MRERAPTWERYGRWAMILRGVRPRSSIRRRRKMETFCPRSMRWSSCRRERSILMFISFGVCIQLFTKSGAEVGSSCKCSAPDCCAVCPASETDRETWSSGSVGPPRLSAYAAEPYCFNSSGRTENWHLRADRRKVAGPHATTRNPSGDYRTRTPQTIRVRGLSRNIEWRN
jgi:hypothetical protein